MKVILLGDVDRLGARGDVVTVKPGYARNYLLPLGFAVPVTKANLEQIEKERVKAEEPADRAPGRGREATATPPVPKDDLAIVWDIEDDGEASPASTRRTSSRRRRR